MPPVDAKSKPALGFLTVVRHEQHGLFGGYLLLSLAGRPLEFHCTAPIKPNRAQQILYGPTLEPFLYGEQIGHTLVQKAKIEPLVVCTDQEPVLAVRPHVDLPVALVVSDGGTVENAASQAPTAPSASDPGVQGPSFWRVDQAHRGGPGLILFTLGRNRLAVPQASGEDQQRIARHLAELADSFDLAEPFCRIREAIEEAQRPGR